MQEMATFLKISRKISALIFSLLLFIFIVYISIPRAPSFITPAAPIFVLPVRSWITPRCLFLYVNLIVFFIIRSEKQQPSDHGAANKHTGIVVEVVPEPEIPSEEQPLDNKDAPVRHLKKSDTWERRKERTIDAGNIGDEAPAKREMRKSMTYREGRQTDLTGWRGRDALFERQEELNKRCDAFIRMNREQMRRRL